MDVGGFGVDEGVGVFGLSGLGVNVAVGAEVAEGVGVGDSACVAFVAVAAGRGVSVLTTEGVSEGAAVAELTTCAAKKGVISVSVFSWRKKKNKPPPISANNSKIPPPVAIHLKDNALCLATTGAATCPSKGLPQVVQNFTPGALAAPQPEQAESAGSGVSECPQLTQNLVRLSLEARQWGHTFCHLSGVS